MPAKHLLGGTWSLAEAKAKFSELVERARTEGPQHLTRMARTLPSCCQPKSTSV
jgi:hypothetical protein